MLESGMVCLWLLAVHNTLAGRFSECHSSTAKAGEEMIEPPRMSEPLVEDDKQHMHSKRAHRRQASDYF